MYNATILSDRIKSVSKIKKIALKDMLTECCLGINAISQLKTGIAFSSESLYKIADYLDVSVDYLLGRTDNPEINK